MMDRFVLAAQAATTLMAELLPRTSAVTRKRIRSGRPGGGATNGATNTEGAAKKFVLFQIVTIPIKQAWSPYGAPPSNFFVKYQSG
jgi:hypothetical protein